MDLVANENLIFRVINAKENKSSQVSVEWIEKQFLTLLHMLELKLKVSSEEDIRFRQFIEDWHESFDILTDLAYYAKFLFSAEFVSFFEIWSLSDNNADRLLYSAHLNDHCLSEVVYTHIKCSKEIFQGHWDGDCSEMWEAAVFLFERYDKKPFSLERYERIHG